MKNFNNEYTMEPIADHFHIGCLQIQMLGLRAKFNYDGADHVVLSKSSKNVQVKNMKTGKAFHIMNGIVIDN